MGTSSSYGGPSGGGGLLPPWVDDPDGPENKPPVQSPELETPDSEIPGDQVLPSLEPSDLPEQPWSAPKASLTRYASSVSDGHPNLGYAANATRGFIRAQGGAKHASRASRAGRSTAVNLGGFLGFLSSQGATRTAEHYGLQHFLGKPASQLLAGLCDAIAPSGDMLEDSVARTAMVNTLADAFDQNAIDEKGLEALEHLDSKAMGEIVESYVAYYIYYRLVEVLAKNLEMSKQTKDVISTEQNLRDFVLANVRLESLSGIDFASLDWQGSEGTILIERLFQEAFNIFENLE